MRGGWGCGSIKLWARGLKPLYSLVSGEELAGLSNMLELSPLLSKTAWSANVVVGLRGVLGEVVVEGVVGALHVVGADVLSRFTFCRHLPYRFQMGVVNSEYWGERGLHRCYCITIHISKVCDG